MASARRAAARATAIAAALMCIGAALACTPAPAAADDLEGASWRLEDIGAPELAGVPSPSTPVGLGPVGDIEFWKPDRGLLITAGSGNTIPAGLWAYNGVRWHELSSVCGATDGRIAWAGPDEFWTVSDGRPGQAAGAHGPPPLEDDTLCHFAGGAVVASYAVPAFEANSYQSMQGAACISRVDCWFAGDALPEPQVGSFHLHWNGGTGVLEEAPYIGEGRAVEAMRAYGGGLYESVRISSTDPVFEHLAEPPVLHLINPIGISPTFEPVANLPLYAPGEFPEALEAMQLSADGESLWAAAGPRRETPAGSLPGAVTVLRYTGPLGWSQLVGPATTEPSAFAGRTVRAIAAEPGTGAAWIALAPTGESGDQPAAVATVARVQADGTVSDVQTLPSEQEAVEGVGPKGAASHLACPAPHECWLATTQGWLFHLTATPPGTPPPEGVDSDPAFAGIIAARPHDIGLPEQPPDAPPSESSGLPGEPAAPLPEPSSAPQEAQLTEALVSGVHLRLLRGTTLEMRFHLAVKARVRLLAKRHGSVVAATRAFTFASGQRRLLLALDRRRWPTKLQLESRALAKLPTVPESGGLEHPFTTGLLGGTPRSALSWSGPFR